MSSDDSSDSGFDKEAEREKLRKKYEEDEKDRENTRRMSELLLQGATMTGKHCGECGDPIFRYDGQEFCPTCQREVEGGNQQGEAQRQSSGEEQRQPSRAQNQPSDGSVEQSGERSGAAEAAAETDPSTEESNAIGATDATEDAEDPADANAPDDEPRVEINDVRVADRHADRSNVRQPPSQQDEADQRTGRTRRGVNRSDDRRARMRNHSHDDHTGHDDHTERRPNAGGRASTSGTAAGDARDLATARESLVRKLTDLARRAEETEDVARSRDLLAATREAAEALAALDRADR